MGGEAEEIFGLDRRRFMAVSGAAGLSLAAGSGAVLVAGGGLQTASAQGAMLASDASVDRWVYTTCQFCATGCGLHIGVKGDTPVTVRGNANYSVNRGLLCQKSLFQAQVLRAPGRATHPLVRRNGQLVQASWDEALDLVAGHIRRVLDTHGPDGVAIYNTGQLLQEEYYAIGKLARAAIGTRHLDGNPRLCMASAVVGYARSFGTDGPPSSYEDIDQADCIVVTGANLTECHPIIGGRVVARLARGGCRLIVIDPRAIQLARMADVYLPMRPGTDVALLNGIQHVLIRDGMIDQAYIDAHSTGFEDLKKLVAAYTPERVAQICEVPAESIERAARYFGQAKAALTMWTMGINQTNGATAAVNQICNMHVITGQIGRPGTGPFSITGQPSSMDFRQAGGGSSLPGYRALANEAHRAQMAEFWGVPVERIPQRTTPAHEIFAGVAKGEIKVLWNIATNPVVSFPNAGKARADLSKAELLIVQDGYHPTETTEIAHVVLPAAIWGEKTGTFTNSERRVNLLKQAVPPIGQARSDFDIVVEVARRLGYGDLFPFKTTEDAFEELKRITANRPPDLSGITFARLEQEGGIQTPCPAPGHPGTKRLYTDGRYNTADGKARLWAIEHTPPPESPDTDYPYWLVTGRTQEHWHTRTKTGRITHLNKWAPEAYAEINPKDARKLGVQSMDRVEVRSRRGQISLVARVTAQVAPGSVFIPFHFGKQSANALTIDAYDPLSFEPNYKQCAVAVRKAPA
jgi:ferredoxin-nitrate reductase